MSKRVSSSGSIKRSTRKSSTTRTKHTKTKRRQRTERFKNAQYDLWWMRRRTLV